MGDFKCGMGTIPGSKAKAEVTKSGKKNDIHFSFGKNGKGGRCAFDSAEEQDLLKFIWAEAFEFLFAFKKDKRIACGMKSGALIKDRKNTHVELQKRLKVLNQ